MVRTEKSGVIKKIKGLKAKAPSSLVLLKQLAMEKGELLADWYELDAPYWDSENYQRMLKLIEIGVFINKEISLFKFKNNLVKQVVMEYFDIPQKS